MTDSRYGLRSLGAGVNICTKKSQVLKQQYVTCYVKEASFLAIIYQLCWASYSEVPALD